jgi:alcohol dehydrogenase class IV
MNFDTYLPTQFIFGSGRRQEIPKLVSGWGQCAMLISGHNPQRNEWLARQLSGAGFQICRAQIKGEPTVAVIEEAVRQAREFKVDFVVGVGGGAVIDAAKAIAGLIPNDGPVLDYLEVVGKGRPLVNPAKPWLAIPTTAGTGAEATRNAVLGVPEHKVKVSLRSPQLFARATVIDPELTLDLPPLITATTGMDALTQLLEAYVCNRANPFTDALCAVGLPRAAQALPLAFADGRNLEARTELSLASWWSGIALSQAGLGAVHGFAAPIGGGFPNVPHGGACASLLAPVMMANIKALQSRSPEHPALERYREIACWFTGNKFATAKDGVNWVRALVKELKIPKLSSYGISANDHADLIAKAQQASSMKPNPVQLTPDELEEILVEAE